ncbi:MAG TPA: DUF4190 domain-containing protein [Bacteroidales bacterium]|nr:DUF4190 domain-containing protein [Bacteroidales bacterium]
MNLLRSFLFIVMALTIFLNSCTLEKRVYRTGYQIEWKNKISSTDQQESRNNSNRIQKEKNHNFSGNQVLGSTNPTDSNSFLADKSIIASTDREFIISIHKKSTNFIFTHIPKISKEEKQNNYHYKSDKEQNTKIIPQTFNKSEITGWAKYGFICSIAGLFISLLLGILMLLGLAGGIFYGVLGILIFGILGVIFSSVAISKVDKADKKSRSYAIAGLVIGILDLVFLCLLVYGITILFAKY